MEILQELFVYILYAIFGLGLLASFVAILSRVFKK